MADVARDAGVSTATVSRVLRPSGEELGSYTRIEVPGADEAALTATLEDELESLLGPDAVNEELDVGGKPVSVWYIADQPQAYIHSGGETIHLFLGPEDVLELILAELP